MALAPSKRRLRWEATAVLRALARWRPDVHHPDAMRRVRLPAQR
jgi:hypothetical protein